MGLEMSSPGRGRTVDAGCRRWKCRKALFGDHVSTSLAPAVRAITKPLGCPVQIVKVTTGLAEQAKNLSPLERDSGPFWVVLVVIGGPGGGLGDVIQLTRQRRHPQHRAGAFFLDQMCPLLGWRRRGVRNPLGHDDVNGAPAAGIPSRQPVPLRN